MAVSYNKMSAIKVAGTYVNNIASGTSLGNVSLDITGKSHFTSDVLIDGSFNILNINSSNITSDFNLATNQTTGNLNIGTGLTTGTCNISTTATGNAPIVIGSTASTTQTCNINAITTFSKIPSTSVAPTTSNHLCNKTYVDSVVGGSILGTNNTFTGTNAFNTSLPTSTLTPSSSTELTTKSYVDSVVSGGSILATNNTFTGTNAFTKNTQTRGRMMFLNPTTDSARMDIYNAKYNSITLANASGGGGQSSNVNLNVATLSVAANNNQSRIRVSIPIVLAAVGLTFVYSGDLTITYSDVYEITILKNGVLWENVSVWEKTNWLADTRTWTGWAEKLKYASSYFGNIDFYIPLDTTNTSSDTYTIGLAITFSLNVNSPYFVGQFVITGNPYFTQTHASTSIGTTYTGTDPSSFYNSQITSLTGGVINANDNIYMDAASGVDIRTGSIELKTTIGSINLKAGSNGAYTAGGILLKTYGTGDINLESSDINITGGNVSITGGITIGGAAVGGMTLSTSGSNSTITAPTNIAISGSTLSVLGTNTTTTTRIEGSTIEMRSQIKPLYTASVGAQVAFIGSRVVVPFTTSTSSSITTVYTQANFPIGVWIIEVKMTYSYASTPPAGAWYRIGTSGAAGSFNDPTRMMDYNPNSSGQQNVQFTTTYQMSGSSTFYVIQQHSGTTITTPTDGSYVSYTRIG